jgi:hypothetical protein
LDVPYASAGPEGGAAQLSDLRDGARTDDAAGGEAANPELRDMRRRFWVCAGLAVPLVALAMAEDFATLGPIGSSAAVWVQIVLATPAELFWILKHGIKMTGMPSWGDHSDGELWATGAFIEKLPGMTEQDYARLVMEDVAHGGHHGGDQDQTKHDAHSHH